MPEISETISHSRIVEIIGQGGRSELCRDTDTKLGRKRQSETCVRGL